jgi:hypothetical protein
MWTDHNVISALSLLISARQRPPSLLQTVNDATRLNRVAVPPADAKMMHAITKMPAMVLMITIASASDEVFFAVSVMDSPGVAEVPLFRFHAAEDRPSSGLSAWAAYRLARLFHCLLKKVLREGSGESALVSPNLKPDDQHRQRPIKATPRQSTV